MFDLIAHLRRQFDWSESTFGPYDRPGRRDGAMKHLRKECDESDKDPTDLVEYVDIMILACDAARAQGFTPEQIAEAWAAKHAKNEARTWPDWRTVPAGEPIEHDRTGEAPQADSLDGVLAEVGVRLFFQGLVEAQEVFVNPSATQVIPASSLTGSQRAVAAELLRLVKSANGEFLQDLRPMTRDEVEACRVEEAEDNAAEEGTVAVTLSNSRAAKDLD